MCETMYGSVSPICQKNYDSSMNNVLNSQTAHKAMSKLNNQGSIVSIRLDTSLVGTSKVRMAIHIGHICQSLFQTYISGNSSDSHLLI